jgi:hypothetical protein
VVKGELDGLSTEVTDGVTMDVSDTSEKGNGESEGLNEAETL